MCRIMKKLLFGFIILGVVSFTCTEIKTPVVTNVKFVGLDSFVNGKYYCRGTVNILNPGAIQISSKNIVFDLFYKGKIVTTGEAQEDFVLKPDKEVTVPVKFAILVDSLLVDANEILSKDTVEFNSLVKGNFTVLNFKLEHEQKVKIPLSSIINGLASQKAKEGFKIKNPTVKKIGIETTTINLDVALKNDFPIDLLIEKIDFSVYTKKDEKNKVSSWVVDKKFNIPSLKDTVITTDLIIDNSQAVSNILERLASRKLDFYVVGSVIINYKNNPIKIPVRQHLEVNPLTGEITIVEDSL